MTTNEEKSGIILDASIDKSNFILVCQTNLSFVLPPFPKNLPTYCSHRYQGKSSCVGHGVSKVGERKGLR